jgi:hypothetical protein
MRKTNDAGNGDDTYAPLLDETADNSLIVDSDGVSRERLFKKNPFENSWFISKLFFSWVTPLARVSRL